MSRYTNTLLPTNMTVNGSRINKRVYQGNFSKHDVTNILTDLSNKHHNLTFMPCILLPNGYRSAREFQGGHAPSSLDDYDWNETEQLVVYGWKTMPSEGGDDEHNDCLWNAIIAAVGVYRMPKDIKTPDVLKAKLGLKRDDKIPVTKLHQVEALLGVSITVDGYFEPAKKRQLVVNLDLINNHYRLKENNGKTLTLTKQIPKYTQKLIMCNLKADEVETFDGEVMGTMTYEEYYNWRHIGLLAYVTNVYADITDITEKYRYMMEQTAKLRELSDGRIDLAKSGYRPVWQAKKMLNRALFGVREPHPITMTEQNWLYGAFRGGLIFTKPCELEMGYLYDINSAYPACMAYMGFTFPITEGEFTQLQETPPHFNYGIYRCRVIGEHHLFKLNNENLYTHFDLQLATVLNLTIEMIIDAEANVLYYPERVSGLNCFKSVVNELYELKKQSPLAKAIINSLWGSLCERNKITKTSETINGLDTNKVKILSITPMHGKEMVKYAPRTQLYKTHYARIGCFLTAYARLKLARAIIPYQANIVRAHTDSILSNAPLPHLKISPNLGDWKLENSGKCIVGQSNKAVEWLP